MKSHYFRMMIQLTYFIMVLIIKILNENTQYFQVIFSIVLTLLWIPLNKLMKNYVENSQLVCNSLWQVLNLFCLGSIDIGLKNEGFLSRFQYFWLGFTIQLQIDSVFSNKIIRIAYLIVVIAAVNLTGIYLLLDYSTLGLICIEILYTQILIYQFFMEKQKTELELPKQNNKKAGLQSFTEKQDSPQPQPWEDDSNQVQILSLSQGIRHASQHSRDPYQKEQFEQSKNFYKILFNQFPEGIVIINDQNKIQYHNNQIYKLLRSKQHKEDLILERLNELKNYLSKFQFEEQAHIDKLFTALNKKLKNSSHNFDQQFEEENSLRDSLCQNQDDVSDYNNYFEEGLSKAENLSIEIEKALSDKNGLPSPYSRQCSLPSQRTQKGGQEKIKFFSEIKMLCMIEENKEEDMNELKPEQQPGENSGLLIQITLKPYLYEGKRNVLLMLRDVTLFNQFTVLEQQNTNKSKMLSQVAHELRNPLGAIIAITTQLIQNIQDLKITDVYLKPLKSSTEAIQRLTNDLLDLAQLRAGKFKLTYQEFSLKQLLIDVISMMTFTVESKKLKLNLKYDNKIPLIIKSDSQRIQQIILNLINNSTKFTTSGGITIETELVLPKIIEISVQDTGVGLKEDDIQKLFKPFGKLEDSKNLNAQGVGLGLMISNVLAMKLSGNDYGLKVDSKGIGEGTKFKFRIQDQNETKIEMKGSINQSQEIKQYGRKESNLSIVYVQKSLQPTSASKYRAKVVSEQKIPDHDNTIYKFQCDENKEDIIYENCQCPQLIIVDDEAVNLKVLGWKLNNMNYKYQEAYSGEECLNILKNWHNNQLYCCNWIRCIIIDISMAGLDGYSTTKLIRQYEQEKQLNKCIIIGCSGFTDDDSKKQGFESGMDYFITKPINEDELKTLLKQCC